MLIVCGEKGGVKPWASKQFLADLLYLYTIELLSSFIKSDWKCAVGHIEILKIFGCVCTSLKMAY